MWQRFTERARRVILLGQEEAGRMQTGHVGTEHLLLGLAREEEGAAAQVLQTMGISLERVRAAVETEMRANGSVDAHGEPKLTPKAKRVLELAADEARRMRHNYIGTEHLLLALLRETDGVSARALQGLGLNLAHARSQVMEFLGPEAAQPAPRAHSQNAPPTVTTFDSAMTLPPKAQIEWYLSQFVGNLNAGAAFPDDLKLVFGARRGYFGANVWAEDWNRERAQRQILLQGVSIELLEEDLAQANVSYSIGAATPSKTPLLRELDERGWTEIVTLKRVTEKEEQWWQIVPPDEFPLSNNLFQPGLLGEAAFALAQHPSSETPQNSAKRALTQLKHLSLAALQFTADWGENFAFAPEYLVEALGPYLRSLQILTIPGTQQTYAFNNHLCGKELGTVEQPAQTVLFYEGQAQQLTFSYDGKAAVAFVDGHCELITPEAAQNIRWEP